MNKLSLFNRLAGLSLLLNLTAAGCDGSAVVASSSEVIVSSVASSSSSLPPASSSIAVSSLASSSVPVVASSASSIGDTIPAGATLVYAVNAGGPLTTLDGVEYQADRFARGGTQNATTSAIAGTNNDTLYQTERYGTLSYDIPVSNATYSVKLHFVEMYQTTTGARLFSATVEGEPAVQNLDIFQEVGSNTAYDVIVPAVSVADNALTLELDTSIDNATLSGFAIYSDDGGVFEEPPTPEPGEALPSIGCGTSKTLQDGRRNISVNGGNRSYILRTPANYNNQTPYRLVMAYHWLNGNAEQVANGGMGGSTDDPFYGLWDLADNSTIFVAPEGLNSGWANTGGADIRLTDAILAELESELCIDKSRIFATGFSYGAGMSNAIACARGDVFRGVALYAGAQLSGCDGGTTPIAYFGAHGLSDSVLNISQGRSLRDRFAANNNCSATNAPEPANGSGSHICTEYQGCDDGFPVTWCAFDGDHYPTQKDRGQAKSWIPGEAWKFISQF